MPHLFDKKGGILFPFGTPTPFSYFGPPNQCYVRCHDIFITDTFPVKFFSSPPISEVLSIPAKLCCSSEIAFIRVVITRENIPVYNDKFIFLLNHYYIDL